MLIDEVLPGFDVTRVDTIVGAAPAEDVYRTALTLDLVQVIREDPSSASCSRCAASQIG